MPLRRELAFSRVITAQRPSAVDMMSLMWRASTITESVIREMTRLSQRHGSINLAQGFPDFDPPPELLAAAERFRHLPAPAFDLKGNLPHFASLRPLKEGVFQKMGDTGHRLILVDAAAAYPGLDADHWGSMTLYDKDWNSVF